ncbi:SGNH/GDSL hydrolase family protein [Acidiluteibacter ferrifornacis]|uniref:SGNH hydrolase-type esterase domain-containing protein n=1 Tax=Acidiluteibacter ferrifornacis TaxID=2692424 RepID=A0A6N9NM15_9FLAO|nr:SGNH/GDSL hydrolase family protein [Acidiluteibacter ferrifornacis]MBR9831827.1 hypothetical protein [bacterium]NBG66167.1 hypothetical protein [Acidiluteibacter ferrifornacis]
MNTKKVIFRISSIVFLSYCILVFSENQLEIEVRIDPKSTESINIKRRFLSLREIDPKLHLENKSQGFNFSADQNGFINPSGKHKDSDIDIVFLGGSTTECLKVDENLRFPYLTGKILGQKSKLKINTFNASRAGNNSLNSYVKLLNVVVPMRPDYAVVMHNINDLVHLIYTESYWSTSNKYRLMVSSFDSTSYYNHDISSFYKNEYYFPNTIKAIKEVKSSIFKKRAHDNEWINTNDVSNMGDTNQIYADFTSALEIFVHTCIAWDIKPILMTQQNRALTQEDAKHLKNKLAKRGLSLSDFNNIYKRANTIIRNVAQQNKIDLIDLDQKIPKTAKYMKDFVHFNNEGSQLAANIISDALLLKINTTRLLQAK